MVVCVWRKTKIQRVHQLPTLLSVPGGGVFEWRWDLRSLAQTLHSLANQTGCVLWWPLTSSPAPPPESTAGHINNQVGYRWIHAHKNSISDQHLILTVYLNVDFTNKHKGSHANTWTWPSVNSTYKHWHQSQTDTHSLSPSLLGGGQGTATASVLGEKLGEG